MYNYSFRPTFPLYHRSAQILLAIGFGGAVAGIAATVFGYGSVYENLPFVILSLITFLGFIIQYVRYTDRREHGHFYVVDVHGFHAYAGRQNDIQMRWEHVVSVDRDGYSLLVQDNLGKTHHVELGSYQRIDRLRIECLMHQFHMHHIESHRALQPIQEMATVA